MKTNKVKIKIQTKLLTPIAILLFIAGVLSVIVINKNTNKRIESEMLNIGIQKSQYVNSSIHRISSKAILLASNFVIDDYIIKAYQAENDSVGRILLQRGIAPHIAHIKELTGLGREFKLQFYKTPAISFLKTWETPDNNDDGDDLSDFRKSILKVASTGEKVSGLEVGKSGLVMRGIVPVKINGELVGSVESFFDLDDFFKQTILENGENIHIFLPQEKAKIISDISEHKKIGHFYHLASGKPINLDSLITPEIIESGQKKLSHKIIGKTGITSFPIYDYSGKAVGVVIHTYDLSDIIYNAKSSQKKIIITLIIAILLGILSLIITVQVFIIRPIKRIGNFLKKITVGDLTAQIKTKSNDEIGFLIKTLNSTFEKITEVITSTKLISANLTHAGKYLNASSQQVAQGASEQAASVEQVSASMEEMSANIEQNAENAATTEKEVYLAAAAVYEGNKSVQKTSELMNSIADKALTITEIAKQTNILALNASVEAANAGEYGEGFAVIAREIRTLAETSRTAAIEIQETIESGVAISDKSSNQLTDIVKKMELSSEMIRQIVTSSKEQKNGAEQVVSGVQQLNRVTQQNAAIAEELATNAEQLASQSDDLSSMVQFFTTTADDQIETKEEHAEDEIESVKQTELISDTNQANDTGGFDIELNTENNDDSDFELY